MAALEEYKCKQCGSPYVVEGHIDHKAPNDDAMVVATCGNGHRRIICGIRRSTRAILCPGCKEWTKSPGETPKYWPKFCKNCGTSLQGIAAVMRYDICAKPPTKGHLRCIVHLKKLGITEEKRMERKTGISAALGSSRESRAIAATIDAMIEKVLVMKNWKELVAKLKYAYSKLPKNFIINEREWFEEKVWLGEMDKLIDEWQATADGAAMIPEAVKTLNMLLALREKEEKRWRIAKAEKDMDKDLITRASAYKLFTEFVNEVSPVFLVYVVDEDGRQKIGEAIKSAGERFRGPGRNVPQASGPARATTRPKRKR